MKYVAIFTMIAGLAACGANGAPLRPTGNLGVSIGSNGITPNASVGATSGPFSVAVGL